LSLVEIQNRMRAAGGRGVRLLAISKLQPLERVRAVLDQGQRDFGENRVQEAASKWPDLMTAYTGISLHLVGPLQSNKVRQAMGLFSSIHSVDRIKLARRIADIAQEMGSCPELFIQVNTGEEPQKSGVLPAQIDEFTGEVRALGLPVAGLMCIPPLTEEPALHFGLLANLARRNGLTGLSMGMSGDFETAIRLGATHIRIGSALFGARPG